MALARVATVRGASVSRPERAELAELLARVASVRAQESSVWESLAARESSEWEWRRARELPKGASRLGWPPARQWVPPRLE